MIIGVRFRSITNGCITSSSEEWKPRNCFNGGWYSVHFRVKIHWKTVLQLREGGWHQCGTCQMDSDAKVSGGVAKVERKWYKLQRIIE